MIKRFDQRIAAASDTARLDSAEYLADTRKRYVQIHNQHISQKAFSKGVKLHSISSGH